MNLPKLKRIETHLYGLGVFADEDILAGTLIDSFNGSFAPSLSASQLPTSTTGFDGRHAIQCARYIWRDGKKNGFARYLAHSCEPNCGIVGRFNIISMRNIKKGEELTWDYAMTEVSDAQMKCLCGSSNCRGLIGSLEYLNESQFRDFVIRNRGFISKWILEENQRNILEIYGYLYNLLARG
ncbi:MAG: hypothetical protein COV30_02315 [Candidatus Yanofskybacteria bacterium CG10_big_fil_rev_8_21_14_0_10_37_15]|uniref:SET domain-containing protein-lysine N-methyltransferase n=1 Tax=Candidatus Yanofskybacteria bacterium CG10_big_fil_rev_8_21_14_0_10_37_15 TaxID=1975097 RepID=A0A2H0R5B3_9BACT|nr:MAG: hypothetical protein COV30_02315 [Candidatus Yanofskybacteria bacterium CG10_big_fil_rev_8_21_14_0_10_37_15]